MSAWHGKYVIGLTGNIATGKSVVRKMLEHLGAYGIDADSLGHRVMVKGAPAYKTVVDTFGKWILAPDGQIERVKLGSVVFSSPEAMQILEKITHPYVLEAVDFLIQRSNLTVVVVEAIKLIESGLAVKCDSIWVTDAPKELQLARLMQNRNMKEQNAHQRIIAQPSQKKKIAAADVQILNEGSFEDTWQQVVDAWNRLVPVSEAEKTTPVYLESAEASVLRAKPRDAEEVAKAINQLSEGKRELTKNDVMAAFGEKAFLLLRYQKKVAAIVGWKVENLIARTDDVFVDKQVPFVESLKILMNEVERASKELQCEISLLFLPKENHVNDSLVESLGYVHQTIDELSVRVWKDAALESMSSDSVMFFKKLRKDRVLKPV
jgi:dephospho-CoA kinase